MFIKMTLKVIGFYRKGRNPFPTYLVDPTFYILVSKNNKVKEYTLKLSGRYYYVTSEDLKDFKPEEYKNYTIITNFLLGDNQKRIRDNWGLTKDEYRELIYGLYFLLIKNYSNCGWFKKSFLLFIGFLKFYLGRLK